MRHRERENCGSASGGQQKAKETGGGGWRERDGGREKGSASAELSENMLQPVETALSAKWSESKNSPSTLASLFYPSLGPQRKMLITGAGAGRGWGGYRSNQPSQRAQHNDANLPVLRWHKAALLSITLPQTAEPNMWRLMGGGRIRIPTSQPHVHHQQQQQLNLGRNEFLFPVLFLTSVVGILL